MNDTILPDELVTRAAGGGRILLMVLDGLGGLPREGSGRTELEEARTPNLDALAGRSSLGMLVPVAPGIAPGSGPGHLALFGYDPVRIRIGRGILSALGVGFDLEPGDVAARLNLATLDAGGRVVDRRAGRPSDAEGRRAVEKLAGLLPARPGVRIFLQHEKEHRAVLILRGQGLGAEVEDTDPQATGVPPYPARPCSPDSARTAEILQGISDDARRILADEPAITGILARGIDGFHGIPSLSERFGLRGAAIARYPMYRGVARLVGMDVPGVPGSDEEALALLNRVGPEYDFCFFHYKAPDARGEDGDFDQKVAAIEAADRLLPALLGTSPEVVAVTGDHSTPATFRAHSWHSVPVLLASRWARPTAATFGENSCRTGDLGTFEARHLMTLCLAHAGRLSKFGA